MSLNDPFTKNSSKNLNRYLYTFPKNGVISSVQKHYCSLQCVFGDFRERLKTWGEVFLILIRKKFLHLKHRPSTRKITEVKIDRAIIHSNKVPLSSLKPQKNQRLTSKAFCSVFISSARTASMIST